MQRNDHGLSLSISSKGDGVVFVSSKGGGVVFVNRISNSVGVNTGSVRANCKHCMWL